MATRRKAVTRSRITTRSSKAKQQQQPEELATIASHTSTITNTNTTTTRLISSETCSASNSPVKKYSVEIKNEEEEVCCWSTPKAKRFRIPEIESCPPAPKKQRGGGGACDDDDDASIKCSMRRSSIPFFTPPELADFFFRVSVPNMSAA
ncbi:unnamed protein product [Rhodiola kirilowii]